MEIRKRWMFIVVNVVSEKIAQQPNHLLAKADINASL